MKILSLRTVELFTTLLFSTGFVFYVFINIIGFVDLSKICLMPVFQMSLPACMTLVDSDCDLEGSIVDSFAIIHVDRPLGSFLRLESHYQNTK